VAVAKVLLENGADPNIADQLKIKACDWAIFQESILPYHRKLLELFLKHGAQYTSTPKLEFPFFNVCCYCQKLYPSPSAPPRFSLIHFNNYPPLSSQNGDSSVDITFGSGIQATDAPCVRHNGHMTVSRTPSSLFNPPKTTVRFSCCELSLYQDTDSEIPIDFGLAHGCCAGDHFPVNLGLPKEDSSAQGTQIYRRK